MEGGSTVVGGIIKTHLMHIQNMDSLMSLQEFNAFGQEETLVPDYQFKNSSFILVLGTGITILCTKAPFFFFFKLKFKKHVHCQLNF